MKKVGKVGSKAGGLVFVDLDGNGLYSSWEARATSSSTGDFRLEGKSSVLKGVMVHVGGADLYSGTTNTIYYKAPSSAKVMNALTTVITQLKDDMAADLLAARGAGGESAASTTSFTPTLKRGFGGSSSSEDSGPVVNYQTAASRLLNSLDVKGLNILKEDAYILLDSNKLKPGSNKQIKALETLRADMQLELIFSLGSSVLNGLALDRLDQRTAQDGLVQAIVDKARSGQKIDFSELTHISDAIIAGGMSAEVLSDGFLPFDYIYGMSGLVFEMMSYVDSYIGAVLAKGKSASLADVQGMLGKLEGVFSVASAAGLEIERAWFSSSSLDVLDKYTGSALQALLNGSGADATEVIGDFGRDVFSMTSGKDIWVVKVDGNGSYSQVNAEMNKYDELLNFSLLEDKLKLPVKELMAAGLYGELVVGARGIVNNIVWEEVESEVGSGVSPIKFEEAVTALLDAMGTQAVTVAFHKEGSTYIVQGDGIAGMQNTDILIKLNGVMVEDLSSILI